jgi:plastocyanin
MTRIRDWQLERSRVSRNSCPAIVEALECRALLATVTVDVINFAFNPDPVTINVGDTVHWVWQGDNHSVTSVAGSAISFDSGVHNTGFTFDETFNQAGTIVYYCKIHGVDNGNGTAGGMSSKVIVGSSSPNPTPTPSPTTPTPTPSVAPLVATGQHDKAKVNKAFHQQVARFSEAHATPGNFTVLIDWGDGSSPTFGQVRRKGKGRFTVTGTHQYLTTGVFQVMAMIQDQSGQEADAVSTVTVTGKVRPAHR